MQVTTIHVERTFPVEAYGNVKVIADATLAEDEDPSAAMRALRELVEAQDPRKRPAPPAPGDIPF